jgi:hypothetical protein
VVSTTQVAIILEKWGHLRGNSRDGWRLLGYGKKGRVMNKDEALPPGATGCRLGSLVLSAGFVLYKLGDLK